MNVVHSDLADPVDTYAFELLTGSAPQYRLGFMKKVLIALAIPGLLLLTACDGDSPTNAAGMSSKTYSYRGGEINCYRDGRGRGVIMTCDFGSFYQKYDGLLGQADEEIAEEHIYWVKMKGKSMACLSIGHAESQAIACDWMRYNAKRAVES